MPVKVNQVFTLSLRERLDKFRKTIPDEEGWTASELAKVPAIKGSEAGISRALRDNHWTIKQWSDASRRIVVLLVNPKTLKKYANID